MLKSYEAIVDHNKIRWVDQTPPTITGPLRVLVVIETTPQKNQRVISAVFEKSCGILGKASIQSIDKELANIRNEWDRE